MKKVFLALLLTVAFPVLAHAQSPAASYSFKIFNAGAQNPISTTPIAGAAVTCGIATLPPANGSANPTDLWWDDATAAGKFCHYVSQPTDPLITMPITGNPLEGAIDAISSTGLSSPDSNRAPFTKPGTAPAARTGFTLR